MPLRTSTLGTDVDPMDEMRHSDSPRPDDERVGSRPVEGTRTKDAPPVSGERPERKNPLNLPLALLDVVHGPLPDVLMVALEYIDDLPTEARAIFDEHFAPEDLHATRQMYSGLQKLQNDALPTRQELDFISRPVLEELAEGLIEVSTHAPIPADQRTFIRAHISDPLRDLSGSYLPEPAAGIVRWWFERIATPVQDDRSEQAPPHP